MMKPNTTHKIIVDKAPIIRTSNIVEFCSSALPPSSDELMVDVVVFENSFVVVVVVVLMVVVVLGVVVSGRLSVPVSCS